MSAPVDSLDPRHVAALRDAAIRIGDLYLADLCYIALCTERLPYYTANGREVSLASARSYVRTVLEARPSEHPRVPAFVVTPVPATPTHRDLPRERCRGGCTWGGNGPACGLPGCEG